MGSSKLFLTELAVDDDSLVRELYFWESIETEKERFTCRPVNPPLDFSQYAQRLIKRLEARAIRMFVLQSADNPGSAMGKVNCFDYNPRNQSAEFGYYLPARTRGKGLGITMLQMFLDRMFNDPEMIISKMYATTASGNLPSVKLLKRLGFHLDGIIREHYWFGDERQDQLHFSILKKEFLNFRSKTNGTTFKPDAVKY